ncbi:TonB-dependent receptor [Spirosoma sp. BT702]|uniref:TonB-dependent receptor n=1 Tax=Spirosoma profusum TaxID=2771354 RepID=A0A927AW05_9BACT|nr:carboxypeptidase regulatory-like domain-containing protein [Spirosoma profusum]MBD2705483.1 TonB-dependent receptor [Spirosoma profusum]
MKSVFCLPIWISLLFIGNLANQLCFAQAPTQTLKGRVIDAESGQPIANAHILLQPTQPALGSQTNDQGFFKLRNIPVGRYNLAITAVGYEDTFIQEILVGAGKEVDLTIRVREGFQQLNEVVVKAARQQGASINVMSSVSARSFTIDQTKRFAAAINDPARTVRSFAGVSGNDDSNNQLIIRGNSPKGVLWRMEGIEIPNPNHFSEQGASGGGVSALSATLLSESDFLTGAFPAEYGNAMAGVFDLKLRRGNTEKREYTIQAGPLGLDLAAEGPIGKKGASYLANYRYSTLALLTKAGINLQGDAQTDFQDLAFKVYLPVKSKGTLSIWGVGGLSQIRQQQPDVIEEARSDKGVIALNYRYQVTTNAFWEAIVSFAGQKNTVEQDSPDTFAKLTQQFRNQALRATLYTNIKLDVHHTLRFGTLVNLIGYHFVDRFQSEHEPLQMRLHHQGQTALWQAYGHWKYRMSPSFTLHTGIHGLFFALNQQGRVEPRLGMRWGISPGNVLSAGFGLHSQTESLPTYLVQIPVKNGLTDAVNKDLQLPYSQHFILSYEYRPTTSYRLMIETYLQRHKAVPVGPVGTLNPYLRTFSSLNQLDGYVADSLSSTGTGRNYGIEITFERFLNAGFYFLATSSLYRSIYTAQDGVERGSRFDGRFVFNQLAGKEWKVGRHQANTFGLNVKSTWAGGNRGVPIDVDASKHQGKPVYQWAAGYADQLANYFRIDLRVSFTKNYQERTTTLSLDIQNVTNRLNQHYRSYSSTRQEVITHTQLGLIPVLNWRLEF